MRQSPDLRDIAWRAQSYVHGQADTIKRAVESVQTEADPAFITAQLELEVFRQASQQLAWLDREGKKLPNRRAPDEWDIELLRATASPFVPVTKRMLDEIVTLAETTPKPMTLRGGAEPPKPQHVPMPKDYPGGHGVGDG